VVTTAPILAVLAVMALTAAGCGSSSDTKANEAYADNVCTAIDSWKHQITSIASSFTQAEAATKTLLAQLKAAEAPDTSEGQAAKQQLDQLTTDINNTVGAAKAGLTQLQVNPSPAAIGVMVATLAPQVQSLAGETKSTIGTLKGARRSLARRSRAPTPARVLTRPFL
jgi:hypothetical protein